MSQQIEVKEAQESPALAPNQPSLNDEGQLENINKTPEENTEEAKRPEGLPEKFNSWEDMAKSYAELEKRLSDGDKPEDKAEDGEGQTEDEDVPTAQEAEKQLENKGLDINTYVDEFLQNGQLSEESYSKLAEAGFDQQLVDNYIAGQQAQASLKEQAVKAIIGGDENYAKMTDWAAQNLTDNEITAFNNAVEADEATMQLAVKGLYAKYEASVGREPNLVQGDGGSSEDNVYQNWSQVSRDMSDARYREDEAFRKQVEAKLQRSKI